MKLQVLVRPLLGVVFAVLGYSIASRAFTFTNPPVQVGVYAISIVVFGAVGIFLVPVASVWIRHWSSVFAQRVATEVISQLRLPRISRSRARDNKQKPDAHYINPIVVDTSALIDGRIADVVETGFLYGTLIIPQFVLSELHHIADASDALRRGRGRRGLEVLEGLRKSKLVKAVIYKGDELKEKSIDDKLVEAGKQLRGKILTTDFNLNKVAAVSGVKTLNVNELVNALKTTLLPGERIEVKVIQVGKEKNQGVGYLPDGTMIVVENGSFLVGKTVVAIVSRVLQTVAGRMIFTQIDKNLPPEGRGAF